MRSWFYPKCWFCHWPNLTTVTRIDKCREWKRFGVKGEVTDISGMTKALNAAASAANEPPWRGLAEHTIVRKIGDEWEIYCVK